MHRRHQHMLVFGNPEKPRPQRNLSRQIKRVTCRLLDCLIQPARRPAGSIDHLPTEISTVARHHQLERHTVNVGKFGAQRWWRAMTSATAAPNASASSGPLIRNTVGMF